MADGIPNKVVRVKLGRRKQHNKYNLMMSVNKREVKNETKGTDRAKK